MRSPQPVALDRSVFHGSRLIGPSLAGFCRVVGRGVGIFHKRALVCSIDRSTHLVTETADGHTGGRTTTP
jgi:hypothetical protein